jgi:hypothetical protein
MASSYVNDLRLNEMATGDASGTWGTTTNTNLELIAEAFSYGTEAITTNADTHTTTIADGATDPGRSMYLKYTGTLDSACTITIGPNTVSKVWIIENGTSGSQNIVISQGSGANITIPAGDTKVVYSDGAGAGAAFFDAFASLSVVDLKVQDDLTVTDAALVTGVLTTTATQVATGGITSGSDIISDTDSTDSLGSTGVRWLKGWFDTLTAGTLTVGSGSVTDSSGAISFGDENLTTTGIVTAAGTSVFTNLDISGDIDVDGTTNLDVVDIDGAVDMASTLAVAGDANFDSGTLFVDVSANAVGIGTTSPESRLTIFSGAELDGQAFNVWYGSGNNQPLNIGINRSSGNSWLGWNALQSTTDTQTYHVSNDAVRLDGASGRLTVLGAASGTAGDAITWVTAADIGYEGSVFNEGGADIDFRVESDGNTHMLFVDGGNNEIGMGRTPSNAQLDIEGGSSGTLTGLRIRNSGQVAGSGIKQIWSLNRSGSSIDFEAASITVGKEQDWTTTASTIDSFMSFSTTLNESTAERMRINSSGTLLVGTTSAADTDPGAKIFSSGIMVQGVPDTGLVDMHDFYRGTSGSLTRVGNIRTNGSSTSYNTSSDYRLKEDDVPMTGATERVKALRPINFAWKVDGSRVDGFLAHEVQEIVPEAISGTKDAMTAEVLYVEGDELPEGKSIGDVKTASVPDYQGIDQSKLVPLLTKALQEALTKIEQLETRLETLENA